LRGAGSDIPFWNMQPLVDWSVDAEVPAQQIEWLILRQLIAASAMGVPAAAVNGRFREYLAPLRQFSALTFPSALPWDQDARRRRLFVEGASQAMQLHCAGSIWPFLPDDVAHEKLSIILGGRALPEDTVEGAPEDHANRTARDHLAEFSAAHALKHAGFRVDMVKGSEDVLAVAPDGVAIVVECKRPRSEKALRRAVQRAREQLCTRRCDGVRRLGAIVICVDRLLGDVPSVVTGLPEVPSFHTLAEVEPWLNAVSFREAARVALLPECDLSTEVPFAAALMTLPVFTQDEGKMHLRTIYAFDPGARFRSREAARVVAQLSAGPRVPPLGWRRRRPSVPSTHTP
jgi:hypothetical protein